MSRSDHVHHLFSVAYDRELSGEDSTRFQHHLETCAACAQEYRVYGERLAALHSLPVAPMPVPIRLPTGSPVASRSWRRELRWPRLSATGYAGVGAAVAAAAAVVLIGVGVSRSSTTTTNTAPPPAAGSQPFVGAAPHIAAPGAQSLQTGIPPCGTPLSGPPARPGADAIAPALTNRASATDPARPGQTLTLATASSHVSAAATVRVFAQLSSAAQTPLATPCVTLTVGGTGRPAAPARIEASGAGDITVPAGLARGTLLVLTALVPAGVPSPGDPPLIARLTLTVD